MNTRRAYPANWESLALMCKERAGWKCEHCGIKQFHIATSAKGTPYFIYLHAAHKHHDQGNPEPELLCLCISCHARLDYAHKQREKRIQLECLKHLKRLVESGIVRATES